MKFKKLQKKKREGFTLVEMVIVVTILGILSGIGFMQFGEVQERSKKNADYVAASNLATAASLYINDYPNDIQYENESNITEISIEDLQTKGYISSQPKSQSERKDFNIKLLKKIDENNISKEELYVVCNNSVFYPKDVNLPNELKEDNDIDSSLDTDNPTENNNEKDN